LVPDKKTFTGAAIVIQTFPDRGEQMVRNYGFYGNVSLGIRQKENQDDLIPCILESKENVKPNRIWARLINNNFTFLMHISKNNRYLSR
jgi:hypothetical protein